MIKAYTQVINHLLTKSELTERQQALLELYTTLLNDALDDSVCSYVTEYQMMLVDIENSVAVPSTITSSDQFVDWIKTLT